VSPALSPPVPREGVFALCGFSVPAAMIKISEAQLARIEAAYPGIRRMVAEFESLVLPPCEHCGSRDTSAVQAGSLGRTIALASATSKFHVTANGLEEGSLHCNDCRRYFGPPGSCDLGLYRIRSPLRRP